MTSIKAHFDGNSVVFDEPASLNVGQPVRVIVDELPEPAQGKFSPYPDMTATWMGADDWDERAALHVDVLERVPADFVLIVAQCLYADLTLISRDEQLDAYGVRRLW